MLGTVNSLIIYEGAALGCNKLLEIKPLSSLKFQNEFIPNLSLTW